MQYNADPDFVMRYCIRETALSPLVRRMTFSTEHGSGVMCLLELWAGVQVWTIDFHVPQLPIRPTGDYHYLKLNFCTGGRCEVPLPAGYIYIDQGTLSVDVNPPVGVMLCPGGCYQGLELAVDLEMCGGNAALLDYGIDLGAAPARLANRGGSFLSKVSVSWEQRARQLMAHIDQADLDLAAYRFLTLELLRLLDTGKETSGQLAPIFLTRGQRAIVRQGLRILLAIQVEKDIVHLLANNRVIRQRLIAEARDRMLRQFLLDAPEIFLRVGVVHPAAIGEGDPAHRLCLLGHLLLAQVVAVEIPLVVARGRGAAEAVAVMLGVHDIAIAPAILGKLTPVPVAVASHRSQILERPICPKRIHDFLKLTLEFLGVELVIVVGPPCVVESFFGRSKVHPDMADRAQRRILGLLHLGIEKARLLMNRTSKNGQ